MTSFDNLNLHGYKVLNNTNKWAIAVHGYTSEGETTSSKAKHFYEMIHYKLISYT